MSASCGTDEDGVYVGLSSQQTYNSTSSRPVTPAEVKEPAVRKTAYWRFDAIPHCEDMRNRPDSPDIVDCELAVQMCRNVKDATGNATDIWGQVMSVQGHSLTKWERIGWTCYPTMIAPRSGGGPKGPTLEELARQEFTRVPFTAPSVQVQPPDGRSLIGKPIFVQAGFTGPGNGPGEGHTATLLGHTVVITPVLQSVVYSWGDGTRTGPTKDTGGQWPDGTITHAWQRHGAYTVTITATYTATVSVDGAPPRPMTSTTTRTSSRPITVVESANVLVPND